MSRNYNSGRNYSSNGYRNQNNNYENRGRGGYQNEQPKKRKSGAQYGIGKNGKPYVQGWKVHGGRHGVGMVSYLCVPTQNTEVYTNKSGREWQLWMVVVNYKDQHREEILNGFYNPSNHTVHVKEKGGRTLIIKPSTPRGGWAGYPE